jgi:hypothetical protein
MRDSLSSSTPVAPDRAQVRCLIVPVDAFPTSTAAVKRAIQITHDRGGTITLVALLPPPTPAPELDLFEMRAAVLAGELGIGWTWYCEPQDEDKRAECRYRQILEPLGSLVKASGVDVRLRLLRGDDLGAQLRHLVEHTPGAELVLGNPLKLHDALHDVTGELLLHAPCRLHVDGLDEPPARQHRPLLRRLFGDRRPPRAASIR